MIITLLIAPIQFDSCAIANRRAAICKDDAHRMFAVWRRNNVGFFLCTHVAAATQTNTQPQDDYQQQAPYSP